MNTTKAKNLLSIGITTKGRVDELIETMRIIEKSELKHCKIILIDDGGGGDFVRQEDFNLDLRIFRYDESAGLVSRRNKLAQLCKTKYLMSLDDDSAPESGSIEEVLDLLEENPDLGAVALNLYNKFITIKGVNDEDYVSRYYVGCGHIIDVEVFKKLGGYTGDLFYGHEEIEYSLKLARAGYKIIHKNNYVVMHRKSDINRVVGYNSRYVRNAGWVRGTYLGLFANIIELYSVTKGMAIRQRLITARDHIKGVSQRKSTNKLTFKQYWRWKQCETPSVA